MSVVNEFLVTGGMTADAAGRFTSGYRSYIHSRPLTWLDREFVVSLVGLY